MFAEDEFGFGGQVADVEQADFISAIEQCAGDVAADKAGTAGDENGLVVHRIPLNIRSRPESW
jgi:hypothetical protein